MKTNDGNMDFLKKHIENFTQHFYVCGPDAMVERCKQTVWKCWELNQDGITFEK